eukprot:2263432-Prymnesium_polylepis.1
MGRDSAPAAGALRDALADPDEWVASSAAEALGCHGPSTDGVSETALARALLDPPVRPRRWPHGRSRMHGQWPLVALAKLAGQPGWRRLPPDALAT